MPKICLLSLIFLSTIQCKWQNKLKKLHNISFKNNNNNVSSFCCILQKITKKSRTKSACYKHPTATSVYEELIVGELCNAKISFFAFIRFHSSQLLLRSTSRTTPSLLHGITLYETAVCCVASLHLLIMCSMLPQSTKTKQRVFGWLSLWKREGEHEFAWVRVLKSTPASTSVGDLIALLSSTTRC